MEGWTALTGRPSRPVRNRDPPGVDALYAGLAEDNPEGGPPLCSWCSNLLMDAFSVAVVQPTVLIAPGVRIPIVFRHVEAAP
jgi:hypothetical protein